MINSNNLNVNQYPHLNLCVIHVYMSILFTRRYIAQKNTAGIINCLNLEAHVFYPPEIILSELKTNPEIKKNTGNFINAGKSMSDECVPYTNGKCPNTIKRIAKPRIASIYSKRFF